MGEEFSPLQLWRTRQRHSGEPLGRGSSNVSRLLFLMNKHLVRLFSLLLIPCLVAEPATVSAFSGPVPAIQQVPAFQTFQEQAIPAAVNAMLHSFSRRHGS